MTRNAAKGARTFPRATTPAEALSEAAIELSTDRSHDINTASAELLKSADHDRGLMSQAHTTHLQRMANSASDDFDYSRALRIIERALRLLPRTQPSPFDIPTQRVGLRDRLRARRTRVRKQ